MRAISGGQHASGRLAQGLIALAKSFVLVLGVPITLERLWMLGPEPRRLVTGLSPLAIAFHLGFLAIGLLWAYCSACLFVDVGAAMRGGNAAAGTSWSSSWASAIAGLALLASASGALGSGLGRGHAVALSRPAASPPATPDGEQKVSTGATAPLVVVGTGECLADVAARTTGSRGDWSAIARLNADLRQADGGRLVDPNLIRAGWCLVVPASAAAPEPLAASRSADAGRGGRPGRLDELALLGLGVITTAALARRLKVLGRLATCLRQPGTRRKPLPTTLGALEAAVARLGEATLIDWIELANRLLSRAAGTALPDVRVVRAGVDGIAFLLGAPIDPAPAPFVARGGGRWWVLGLDRPLSEVSREASGHGRFVPALVPVGEDEDAVVLVALGPGRRLCVEGTLEECRAVMAGITVSLRTLPWAEELEVELLGLAPPPANERCYQLLESSEATLTDLAAQRRPARTTMRPRWRREPLVLVGVDRNLDEAMLHAVNTTAGVVGRGGSGSERLVIEGTRARLEPYGLVVAPATPSDQQLGLVDRLLEQACNLDEVVAVPAPSAVLPAPGSTGDTPIALRLLRPAPVLDLETDELSGRDRPRVVELLAYLALHGHVATGEALAEALYPGEPADRVGVRLANVIGAARRALGRGPDGRNRLLGDAEQALRLDPSVSSDWNRFVALAGDARRLAPARARDQLASALALVEGAPMSGLSAGYGWLFAEGLHDVITAEILDAAHHLALLALAGEDWEGAHRAIATGRAVEPACEVLVRDLMVLYDKEGAREELAGVYRDLEDTLTSLFGSEPSLETRALYEALSAPAR